MKPLFYRIVRMKNELSTEKKIIINYDLQES